MDDRESDLPHSAPAPPRRVVHLVTLGVCAVAAVGEPALWVAAAGGFSAQDVGLIIILSAPYLFFALYAWLQRRKMAASWVLFASVVFVALVGLAVAVAHAARFALTGVSPKQDASMGLVACFHWLMVFVCGLLSVVVSAIVGAAQGPFAPEPRPRRRRVHPEDED